MILPTDPKASYLQRQSEIDDAIKQVLQSGQYILGKQCISFESAFAKYVGTSHAIGVATGTDAIELALRACDIGPGDIVLTVSHTAVATVSAIQRAGAMPALVDIDPATYTMDPQKLEDAIKKLANQSCVQSTQKPKAIIPVHLYGHPADMPAICNIAKRHGLVVIEDCAQAHGATINNQPVGSWGDAAAFSFYPTKNLGALGDGGAVTTHSPDLNTRIRQLREYGWADRYISQTVGINSRLDELQAAILNVQLKYLDQNNQRRRDIAQQYISQLSQTDLLLPTAGDGDEHVYHQFVVRTPQRDLLRQYLKAKDIGSLIHYPQAVHTQPAYAGKLPDVGPLTHTEAVVPLVLSLPMYPQLSDPQIQTVCDAILCWSQTQAITV